MKRSCKIFASALVLPLMVVALLTGCEGPQGPQGEMGPQGPQGDTGPQGPAGQDANENCVQCHSDNTALLAKQLQYIASGHATGGHFRYADNTECSICHTHEGFMDRLGTMATEASQEFENGSPPNCRTCHEIHTTYSSADYALTTTDAVTLWINNESVDIGNGNLCVNCHQPRVPDPMPVPGGADVTITSSFGVHHSPQGALVAGTAGYEVDGTVDYPSATHAHGNTASNENGCVTCHMVVPGRGDQAGGHTLKMFYESRGTERAFTDGCETSGCHSSVADFDHLNIQTDVAALLATLQAKLLTAGVLDADGDPVAGTYSADYAGALLNYIIVEEDGTHGVHNPTYVKALLQNSIEVFP